VRAATTHLVYIDAELRVPQVENDIVFFIRACRVETAEVLEVDLLDMVLKD
jgi:hypothetical protein